jgi:hypothetical protein
VKRDWQKLPSALEKAQYFLDLAPLRQTIIVKPSSGRTNTAGKLQTGTFRRASHSPDGRPV